MKVFLLCLLTFIFAGCSLSPPNCKRDENIKVTDFRGKEITLDKPVKKVICLIESALSGIYMLQKEELLVGVPATIYDELFFTYYSQLDTRINNKLLPSPGNWDFISIEQIVSLNPDLVIIWSSQTEAIENIERFGIPVYAVMLNSINDIYKEIEDLGELFDCKERADSLILFTKDKMYSTHLKNLNENPKSAYFMWSQGITETSGTNSTVNELLQAAGLQNACKLKAEHISVSIEKIYDWNPDLIVMWYNEKLDPVDILNNPLLKELKAVKQGEVYELPEVFACDFWTLKIQYPVQLIANWAYKEEPNFELDPQKLQELYLNLYGKALQINEK